MTIHKTLLLRREYFGMTQEHLSKASGVGRVTISEIENGKRNPDFSTLEKLCKALELNIKLTEYEKE